MQQNKHAAGRHLRKTQATKPLVWNDICIGKTETAVALQLVGWHMCVCVLRTQTLNAFRERKSSDEAADEEGWHISQSHTHWIFSGWHKMPLS